MTSKGRRLILMNDISKDGLLCDRDGYGRPIDNLKWNGDTPHPITPMADLDPDADIPRICETLWVSDSSSYDYHDNMNSSMFMQWVRSCPLSTFKIIFQIKMILLLDNAPYHHRRAVPVMTGISKNKAIEMMVLLVAQNPEASFIFPLCT